MTVLDARVVEVGHTIKELTFCGADNKYTVTARAFVIVIEVCTDSLH